MGEIRTKKMLIPLLRKKNIVEGLVRHIVLLKTVIEYQKLNATRKTHIIPFVYSTTVGSDIT